MAYLTVAEYVARFGVRETALLSNLDNTGTIPAPGYDAANVQTKIDDATEEVEGYLSCRYVVPLTTTPGIVKGWVAVIARLKLAEGTGRVSDVIRQAADRATRQLEQLVASKLDIPAETNTPAPTAAGIGTPLTSNDRPGGLFTGGALDGYVGPFLGAGYAPCWRRGG